MSMDTDIEDAETVEAAVDHLLIRIELYAQLARGCQRLSIEHAQGGDLPEGRKWARRAHQRVAMLVSLTKRLDEITGT